MKVIFRPHPQSFISDKSIIDDIKHKFSDHPQFHLDSNNTGIESMASADILVTDLSGVLFDFAYLYTRPIIIVNYETGVGGYEAEDIGNSGYDIEASLALAEKAGEDITKISEKIMIIMKNYDDVSDKIKSFREKNIYNFGTAGAAAAEHIINILKEGAEK